MLCARDACFCHAGCQFRAEGKEGRQGHMHWAQCARVRGAKIDADGGTLSSGHASNIGTTGMHKKDEGIYWERSCCLRAVIRDDAGNDTGAFPPQSLCAQSRSLETSAGFTRFEFSVSNHDASLATLEA